MALRAARVIRQASDALGEAHRNSVLHRNLKPENIVLLVDENGVERVKLTNFCAAKEKLNKHNLLYKSPEQVEGKIANFSSDSYSLAVISEGEKNINNGWRTYEVKFQCAGATVVGEKITLWGRRLFIPPANRGMKNGFVLTMLATSLSKDVKNVDDVGVKGELSTVLETFEPSQNF